MRTPFVDRAPLQPENEINGLAELMARNPLRLPSQATNIVTDTFDSSSDTSVRDALRSFETSPEFFESSGSINKQRTASSLQTEDETLQPWIDPQQLPPENMKTLLETETYIPASDLDKMEPYGAPHEWANSSENLTIRKKVYEAHIELSKGKPYTYFLDKKDMKEVDHSGQYLLPEPAMWLEKLLADARIFFKDQPVRIHIISGYRSGRYQFSKWVHSFPFYFYKAVHEKKLAKSDYTGIAQFIWQSLAAPGFSNHNHGLAIDFGAKEGNKVFTVNTNHAAHHDVFWRGHSQFWAWLVKNAASYHFYPYKAEPWHWDFKRDAAKSDTEEEFADRYPGENEYDFEHDNESPQWENDMPAVEADLEAAARTWGSKAEMGTKIDAFIKSRMPDTAGKTFAQLTADQQTIYKTLWTEIRTQLLEKRKALIQGGLVPALSSPNIPFGFKWPESGKYKHRGLGNERSLLSAERLDKTLLDLHNAGKINITQDELDLFQRIANAETYGKIQLLNSYDSAIVSIGFMQLTLKHGKIQRWIKMATAAFARYGIELEPDGKYHVGDEAPPAIKGVSDFHKQDLRWGGWAERFFYAGLDQEIVVAEVGLARQYVNEHLSGFKRRLNNDKYYHAFIDNYYSKDPYVRGLFHASYNNNPARSVTVVQSLMHSLGRLHPVPDMIKKYAEILKAHDWANLVGNTAEGTALFIPASPAKEVEYDISEYDQPQAPAAPPAKNWCDIRSQIFYLLSESELDWTEVYDPAAPNGRFRRENESMMLDYLEEYWKAVRGSKVHPPNYQNINPHTQAVDSANDTTAWSAAFVCFIMKEAGVEETDGFIFSRRHLTYIVQALSNARKNDALKPVFLLDNTQPLQTGDILCFNRTDEHHHMTHHTLASLAHDFLDAHDNVINLEHVQGVAHCDIVKEIIVDCGRRYAVVVGGNKSIPGMGTRGYTVASRNIEVDAQNRIIHPETLTSPGICFGIIKLGTCDGPVQEPETFQEEGEAYENSESSFENNYASENFSEDSWPGEDELMNEEEIKIEKDAHGTTVYLDISAVNGHRYKTGAFIPDGAVIGAQIDLVLFLHGQFAYGDNIAAYWTKYADIRAFFYGSRRNAILLAPALGPDPQAGNVKLKAANGLDHFIEDCFSELKKAALLPDAAVPNRIIIAAHSAGGSPLSKILTVTNTYYKNISECWGFDCMYDYGWREVLKKAFDKKIFHYWAHNSEGKESGPGRRADILQQQFSQLANIAPGKTVYHPRIIRYAWENEINIRSWFDPIPAAALPLAHQHMQTYTDVNGNEYYLAESSPARLLSQMEGHDYENFAPEADPVLFYEDVKIKSGETILGLAAEYGFDPDEWREIWNDPKNAALKAKRKISSAIRAGDILQVPIKWRVNTSPLTPLNGTFHMEVDRTGREGLRIDWVQTVYGHNQPQFTVKPFPAFSVDLPTDDDLPFYWTRAEYDNNRRPTRISDTPNRGTPTASQGITTWRAVTSACVVTNKRVSIWNTFVWGVNFNTDGKNTAYPLRPATDEEIAGHLNLLRKKTGKSGKTYTAMGWTFRDRNKGNV